MKLLKKINNNYVTALDSRGEQIIAEGKGIGFLKMPCELTDLSKISRTYYDIVSLDTDLIKSIPVEILTLCEKIVDFASVKIGDKLNPNLTFILADHIQFSIERYEKKIEIKMPISYDIEYLYPIEAKVAEYALDLIHNDLKIAIPKTEKTGIMLNIINSELELTGESEVNHIFVDLCVSSVEDFMNVTLDKTSFNYMRFVTHLEYLSKRILNRSEIDSENIRFFESISISCPEIRNCVDNIEQKLKLKYLGNEFFINEEEKLYLILHINRICSREDCNR